MKKQFETAPSSDLLEGLPEVGQENMVSLIEDIEKTKKKIKEIEKIFEAMAQALTEFSANEHDKEEYKIIKNELLNAHQQMMSLGETVVALDLKLKLATKRNQGGKQPHYEN